MNISLVVNRGSCVCVAERGAEVSAGFAGATGWYAENVVCNGPVA
jgi:hypothetical protein